MHKLLSASFNRLFKSRVFWIMLLSVMLLSVFFVIPKPWNTLSDGSAPAENSLFQLIPYLPFICALLVGLFMGVEFEEHTIRNKLIVGHTRTEVFFAAELTCAAACLMLLAGMLISSGLTALIFSRSIQCALYELLYLIVCCVLITLVLSGICVAFVMNVSPKPTIFLMLFLIAMLYAASFMTARLAEPETTYDGVTITMEGGVQFGEIIDNPAYIKGHTTRMIYEFLCDLLPTGQSLQLVNGELDRCLRWAPLSCVMLVLSSLAGYLPFRRRALK